MATVSAMNELFDRIVRRGPRTASLVLLSIIAVSVGGLVLLQAQRSPGIDPLAVNGGSILPVTSPPTGLASDAPSTPVLSLVAADSEQLPSPQTVQVSQPDTTSTTGAVASSSEPGSTSQDSLPSTTAGPSSSPTTTTTSTTSAATSPPPTTSATTTTTTRARPTTITPTTAVPAITEAPTTTEPTTSTVSPCNSTPGVADPCNGGEINPCPGGVPLDPFWGCAPRP